MYFAKTAAQSIPNFWMNLLLILSEVCTVIQCQMNGYWWGNGSNSKGIRGICFVQSRKREGWVLKIYINLISPC